MQKYLVSHPDINVKSPLFFHGSQDVERIVDSFCNDVGEGHTNTVSLLRYLNSENRICEGSMGRCGSVTEFFWRHAFLLCHGKCWKAIGRGKGGRARSDWRLSDLSNWAKGRAGQNHHHREKEREKNMLHLVISSEEPPLGSVARPPQPC